MALKEYFKEFPEWELIGEAQGVQTIGNLTNYWRDDWKNPEHEVFKITAIMPKRVGTYGTERGKGLRLVKIHTDTFSNNQTMFSNIPFSGYVYGFNRDTFRLLNYIVGLNGSDLFKDYQALFRIGYNSYRNLSTSSGPTTDSIEEIALIKCRSFDVEAKESDAYDMTDQVVWKVERAKLPKEIPNV